MTSGWSAAYGVVKWVRNVRASREVVLSRGRRSQRYAAEDAHGPEAVPVLRMYMRDVPVTRAYFDATPDPADDAIAAELASHLIFRLTTPAR